MQQVVLKKIWHREAYRIGIFYEKNHKTNAVAKQIGAKFSATKMCWYVNYTKEAFEQIKANFDNYIIENKTQAKVTEQNTRDILPIATNGDRQLGFEKQSNPEHTNKSWAKKLGFKLHQNVGKYWVFELKFQQSITAKLKTLKGLYWNQQYKCFFAFRHAKLKENIENLLGENNLFPNDFYEEKETFQNTKIEIKAYEDDRKWMALFITNNAALHIALKRISFYRYHPKLNCYLYPAAPSVLRALKLHFEGFDVAIENKLPEAYLSEKNFPNQKKRLLTNAKESLLDQVPEIIKPKVENLMNHLLARNYSASTLKTYTQSYIQFLRYFEYQNADDLEEKEIMKYLSSLMLNGLSSSAGNTAVNALKYYYHNVVGKTRYELKLPRPKREKILPNFLSEQEIKRLFGVVENPKHKLLLLMAYGAGLRVGELVSLKWSDIKWDDHKIHIKSGKGKKDRMVMLPMAIIGLLENYRKLYQSKVYVFEGQFASMPYSTRSVQEIMRKARKKSGLEQKATPHSLRHSFATHLIEKGTDIRYIQQLLGHKDIKTTMIYTHVTDSAINKIESPLDSLSNESEKKSPKKN